MKINDKVHVPKVESVGVIKEFLPNGKAKFTYFDSNDRRQVIEVGIEDIEPVRQDNKYYYMVRDFHRAFNHPYSDTPRQLSIQDVRSRYKWMKEELDEFYEAETLEDQIDAIIDLMYFAQGTMTMLGVKPDPIFEIVHAANMAKLHNGKPKYDEDGKVIKPDGWVAPEPQIKKEIERQMKGRLNK